MHTTNKAKLPFFTRPLKIALSIGSAAGLFGILLSLLPDMPEGLQKVLFTAAVGLIFSGVLTVVIKLLIEDHKQKRDSIADQEQFVNNILNDLKSVYDRVERTRILIPAHKSSLTYGKEMRDLINSRVQLKNVTRALDGESKEFEAERAQQLEAAIKEMGTYLDELITTFQEVYRRTSRAQAVFEAEKQRVIKSNNIDNSELKTLKNPAWPIIAEALHENGFIENKERQRGDFHNLYNERFEEPLDLASWILRSTLRQVGGHKEGKMPDDYLKLANTLCQKNK